MTTASCLSTFVFDVVGLQELIIQRLALDTEDLRGVTDKSIGWHLIEVGLASVLDVDWHPDTVAGLQGLGEKDPEVLEAIEFVTNSGLNLMVVSDVLEIPLLQPFNKNLRLRNIPSADGSSDVILLLEVEFD